MGIVITKTILHEDNYTNEWIKKYDKGASASEEMQIILNEYKDLFGKDYIDTESLMNFMRGGYTIDCKNGFYFIAVI